jgi:hypothetical protein
LEVQRLREKLDARSVPAKELYLVKAQRRKFLDTFVSEYTRKGSNNFPHNNNYLVLITQAIDVDGTDMYHFYSIVMKVGSEEA